MAGLNLFTNNAATTLASGINNTDVSLTVATGTGALFPNPTAGQYFYCTLANNAGTVEIVKVTARSTDTFTIVRGQDGTTAVSWNTGDKVELRLVRASLNNFGQLDSTNTWDLAQTFTQAPVLSALTASKPVFTDGSKNLTSSGTLGIDQGGTGQTTKTEAFDALAPTTTNGDMIYFNGTDNIRLGIGSTDQVLKVTGGVPTWGTVSGGFQSMQIYTSGTGTWTIPAGVTKCKITVVGGGGAGGSCTTSSGFTGGGSGGGGGGAAIRYYTGLTPGNTISYTVGAAASTSSVSSGTQTITSISATGGSAGGAGGNNTGANGGAGGSGSGGNINIGGQGGGAGVAGGMSVGGSGGSSIFGGGAEGVVRNTNSGATNGVAGKAYGGGGSGGAAMGATASGGAGAAGVVIIEY